MEKEKDYVPFLRGLSRDQLIEIWNNACDEVGEEEDKYQLDEVEVLLDFKPPIGAYYHKKALKSNREFNYPQKKTQFNPGSSAFI